MSPAQVHVGIDATSWWNDRGFGRFSRELVTALVHRDSGFRYTLLLDRAPDESLPKGAEILLASTGLTLDESAVGATSRSPRYLWAVGRAVREANFDLFFFPAVYSYFPVLARVPCVVCFHDTTAERLPHLLFPTRRNHLLWKAKTAMARFQATRAMTVSKASAEDLEHILKIPGDRIDTVTEAADPIFRRIEDPAVGVHARTRLGLPADGPLFTYVGGMNQHKNLARLLEAMREVVAKQPDVHLAIVGDVSGKGFWDDVPQLQRFVANHPPLEQHVHFTGYLPDAELVELLNGSSALVFPSLWEGFGLPAVEAMSCGIPVLASDRSSLPEVVGDAGLLFDPERPEDISRCLLEFLGDPALQLRLAEIALERARSFSWEHAAELAEGCFRRCREDAGGATGDAAVIRDRGSR
jgi:glycosyltransferase involved in cell wall biosynthesis